MYCYVIFGRSENRYVRHYLYECTEGIEPGAIVTVPTKDTTKVALVHSVIDMLPTQIDIDARKIKKVISKSNEIINADMMRSYLLALIDDYKDGNTTKEELYTIMEHLVSSSKLKVDDEKLAQILNEQLPDACLYYIYEPGEAGAKELGFWKELKDIEYKLRYGYSFWDRPQSGFHDIKKDVIEYSDEYLKVELEVERLIQSEIGVGGYMGFCHKYWWTKKKILKDKFGIDWKSPEDLNPMIDFD